MKKQSKSQHIGHLAEVEFDRSGLRAGVLPEKVRRDFGVDFLCQVAGPPDKAGTAIVGGAVIGAAVRGTDNRKPKIRLTRNDISKLLSADFPICVVLVHAPSSQRPRLFFRFIDEAFSLKLRDALSSSAHSTVIRSSDLFAWSMFTTEVARVTAPGFVERIRLSRATRAINRILPASRLMVRRTENGELTVVSVTDFFGQFAIESAEEKRQLHAAAFGAASRLTDRFADLKVKPALIEALHGLPSPIAITAPVVEEAISITGPSGDETCVFERRHTNDHFGWVHASGFSITISHAVQESGRWVHIQSSQTDPAITPELQAFPDLWQFLEKCVAGAKLRLPDGNLVLKVDAIGRLVRYGYFARHLRSATKLYSSPAGTWLLTDALAEEPLHTLAWLSALQEKIRTIEGWGMVMSDEKEENLEPSTGTFIVPVCANTPRSGLVTWLTVEGHRMKAKGEIVGFRILTIQDVEIEERGERFGKTEWPELVLHTDLPTVLIPAMQMSMTIAQDWNVGIRLEADAISEEEKGD